MITFSLVGKSGERRLVDGIMTAGRCYVFPDGIENPLCAENKYIQGKDGSWEINEADLRPIGTGEALELGEFLR